LSQTQTVRAEPDPYGTAAPQIVDYWSVFQHRGFVQANFNEF